MSWGLLLFLIVGLPLIILAGAFLVLMLVILKSRGQGAVRDQTLETARRLERSLSGLESRLSALEDILLGSDLKKDRENG